MKISKTNTVCNDVNKTNLSAFRIYGLFDRYNIDLSFDQTVNIYIGENGLGKTTILNCLYYVLSRQFNKLLDIQFEHIELQLLDGSKYAVSKKDIIQYTSSDKRRRMRHYDYSFISEYLDDLNDIVEFTPEIVEKLAQRISIVEDIPMSRAYRTLVSYIEFNHDNNPKNKGGNADNVAKLISAIKTNIPERIIYLPTYRRIESDISSFNIRIDELSKPDLLIRFGMSDVQKSIEDILGKIKDLAMRGYNEMASLLLKQYVDGESSIDKSTPSLDREAVRIVLNRLGDQIEKGYKERIIDLVETDAISKNEYAHLRNLLCKLITNYDLQKLFDIRINTFVDTCNRYLNDKIMVYDPSNLALDIYIDDGKLDKKIQLTQLSSGEKQIVSLFSKVYLESSERSIVVIDEPELSLSISWQQMLLPDIIRSTTCGLLLTVTHSPFIFENEFDPDAKEIYACMTKI